MHHPTDRIAHTTAFVTPDNPFCDPNGTKDLTRPIERKKQQQKLVPQATNDNISYRQYNTHQSLCYTSNKERVCVCVGGGGGGGAG